LVHNLAKHAEASTGRIELQVLVNEIRLTVSDDGKGFPNGVQASGDNLGGYGLFSVRERLSLLGGSLSVVSKETGSSLLLRVPRQAGIGGSFQAHPKPGSWAVQ
jgi:signal transduction histidine kinase